MSNPATTNGGQAVFDAFMCIYGIDIKKAECLKKVNLEVKQKKYHMEKKNYDLTTIEGVELALSYLNSLNPLKYTPVGLIYNIIRDIVNAKAVKEMGDVIGELIQKGKDDGVDEMDIKINDIVGLNLPVKIDNTDVCIKAGKLNEVTIHVKYK